ncbi:hypothetical protein BHM03_00011770 [Ensete ventricosum]|nr:hypothetical protein BHM03_00011770 [Ensete ventricosum]
MARMSQEHPSATPLDERSSEEASSLRHELEECGDNPGLEHGRSIGMALVDRHHQNICNLLLARNSVAPPEDINEDGKLIGGATQSVPALTSDLEVGEQREESLAHHHVVDHL